jgi:hypothetical protein
MGSSTPPRMCGLCFQASEETLLKQWLAGFARNILPLKYSPLNVATTTLQNMYIASRHVDSLIHTYNLQDQMTMP